MMWCITTPVADAQTFVPVEARDNVSACTRPFHRVADLSRSVALNAPNVYRKQQAVQITHPFHPLVGCDLELVAVRNDPDLARVDLRAADGAILRLPIHWTSLIPPDPHVAIAQGRSLFRAKELLELAQLIEQLKAKNKQRSRKRRKTSV